MDWPTNAKLDSNVASGAKKLTILELIKTTKTYRYRNQRNFNRVIMIYPGVLPDIRGLPLHGVGEVQFRLRVF